MAYINNKEVLLAALKGDKGDPGGYSENTVNVKDLDGEIGKGGDDSAIFQQAFNDYDTIIIPKGTYRVKGLTVPNDTKIVGENATLKIIDETDKWNASANENDANCLNVIGTKNNPIRNIEISGIHFDGNCQHFFRPISENNLQSVHHVYEKFANNGVFMQNAENITIHHCSFDNLKDRCIGAALYDYLGEKGSGNENAFGVHGLHVYDCEFLAGELPVATEWVGFDDDGNMVDEGTEVKGGVDEDYPVAAGYYRVPATTPAIQLNQSGINNCNSDIIIERCTVHKATNMGFMFYYHTKNVTIRDCKIMNCGLYTSEGLNNGGDSSVVINGEKVNIEDAIDYWYFYTNEIGDKDGKADHAVGGCIKFNSVENALVENCYLYGARGANISIYSSSDYADTNKNGQYDEGEPTYPPSKHITIRNNRIIGNPNQARSDGYGVLVVSGTDVSIVGNVIKNHNALARNHTIFGTGVKYYESNGICSSYNADCYISGNVFDACKYAVVLNGSNRVMDNTITNCHYGVYVLKHTSGTAPTDVQIVGNRILLGDSNGYTNARGIALNGASNIVVTDNLIKGLVYGVQSTSSNVIAYCGNVLSGCNYGIQNTTVNNVNCNGNVFENCVYYGVHFDQGANVICNDNVFDTCTRYGIQNKSSTKMICSGNSFKSGWYGVYSGPTANALTICGNIFHANTKGGIYNYKESAGGTYKNIHIYGNQFFGFADKTPIIEWINTGTSTSFTPTDSKIDFVAVT